MSFNAIPVRRPQMRPHRVQEVISSHPNAVRNDLNELPGERALSRAAVAGYSDNYRTPTLSNALGDQLANALKSHRSTLGTEPALAARKRIR